MASRGQTGKGLAANQYQTAPPTTTENPITFIWSNVGEGSFPRPEWQTQTEKDLNRQPFS